MTKDWMISSYHDLEGELKVWAMDGYEWDGPTFISLEEVEAFIQELRETAERTFSPVEEWTT